MKLLFLLMFLTGCVTTQIQQPIKRQPIEKINPIPVQKPKIVKKFDTKEFIKVDPNFDPLEEPKCFTQAVDFWELVYTSPGSKTIIFDSRFHEIHLINEDTPWRNRKAVAKRLINQVKAEVDNDSDIKAQIGAMRTFQHGLDNAYKYVPMIQKRLKEEGMPVDLALIPLVESSFNLKARSKVGALGAWQIMPRTFRLYGKGNVKKLYDIHFATEIAIKILKDNYNELGSWPLAINAYHSGQGRLMKAKNELNTTDMCKITQNFDGKGYKSASRNYYAQFLAAKRLYYKHIYQNLVSNNKDY